MRLRSSYTVENRYTVPALRQGGNVCPSNDDDSHKTLKIFESCSYEQNKMQMLTLTVPFRRIHEFILQGIGVGKGE